MNDNEERYKRTLEDLRHVASMFWPPELSEKEAELSIIPKLLETQDQFIAILAIDVPALDHLFQVITSSSLPANLFLKHLVVLADFGGEKLMRINSEFTSLFPSRRLDYLWKEQHHRYDFKVLPVSGQLNNNKLGISGKKLIQLRAFGSLLQDVTVLLIFGSACVDEAVASVLGACEIGNYIGHPDDLQKFIKQRYIWVSRITGGAQAQSLGELAQKHVQEYLQDNLGIDNLQITPNGSMPGVTDRDSQGTGTRPARFDVAISDGTKYAGVEVSFQVTTNSTIERKANQARTRFEQVDGRGYKIAYVIDGAGNFERASAVGTLCSYSHCTVAFSKSELDVLCDFVSKYFRPSDPS